MTRPQFPKRSSRPREHLAAAGVLYPHAWAQADDFRARRGKDLPDWPDWCYLPLAAWYAIVSEGGDLPPERALDIGRLAAIGTWRMTQGVYRYDPALYDAIVATPVDGDIPHEILYRLPEWCVYIETPGLVRHGQQIHGAWAHLESDANDGRAELRLLIDAEDGLHPVPLHLGAWSLSESVARMDAVAQEQARRRGVSYAPLPVSEARQIVEPILSLVLYLCSQAAEIGDGPRRPGNPVPKRLRDGWRLFAADGPRTWAVGVRLGAALRAAYHARETAREGLGASPRPHVRRAHWHTYLIGEGRSERVLRWLPPIPVNVTDPAQLPAVVRRVSDE